MTREQRRLGPHLAILVHQLHAPEALTAWTRERRSAIAIHTERTPGPPQCARKPGPPDIRFANASEALAWFGSASRPAVFTWELQDQSGATLAASAAAFPTILMTERDVRTIQEFADELSLHVVASAAIGELTWFADRDGLPAIFSPRPYPSREQAIRAATVAVGLLTLATVDGYAVHADPEGGIPPDS